MIRRSAGAWSTPSPSPDTPRSKPPTASRAPGSPSPATATSCCSTSSSPAATGWRSSARSARLVRPCRSSSSRRGARRTIGCGACASGRTIISSSRSACANCSHASRLSCDGRRSGRRTSVGWNSPGGWPTSTGASCGSTTAGAATSPSARRSCWSTWPSTPTGPSRARKSSIASGGWIRRGSRPGRSTCTWPASARSSATIPSGRAWC